MDRERERQTGERRHSDTRVRWVKVVVEGERGLKGCV